MSVTVLIRPARPRDAAGIAAVQVEAWRDTYPLLLPAQFLAERLSVKGCTARWQRSLSAPARGEAVIVAEDPRAGILGYASGGPARDHALAYDGEIYELYLLPDRRNQGLGRRLLGTIAQHLYADGMRSVMVDVLAGNPSRYFYEAMGARLVAHHQHRFAGATLPAVIYAWPNLATLMAAG